MGRIALLGYFIPPRPGISEIDALRGYSLVAGLGFNIEVTDGSSNMVCVALATRIAVILRARQIGNPIFLGARQVILVAAPAVGQRPQRIVIRVALTTREPPAIISNVRDRGTRRIIQTLFLDEIPWFPAEYVVSRQLVISFDRRVNIISVRITDRHPVPLPFDLVEDQVS